MMDAIKLMKQVEKNVSEISWRATELRKLTRLGSKAELEAELLYRHAVELQKLVSSISGDMALEDLDFKLRMVDTYGKNTYD